MSDNESRTVEILLIEDNPGDVVLTQEAFKQSSIRCNINVANDGEKALDYLFQRNGYENEGTPDLVLLDLNLPRIDGREVLETIKSHDATKAIPVVVLTSSDAENDIIETYGLHANSYVVKPLSMADFVKVIRTIEQFWFNTVSMPNTAGKPEV